MIDKFFKPLILIVSVLGIIVLYTISVKLDNNRYHLSDSEIIDSKTGDIYFYRIDDGYFKFVKGKKVLVKSLPK
jgi:hypothetical protein